MFEHASFRVWIAPEGYPPWLARTHSGYAQVCRAGLVERGIRDDTLQYAGRRLDNLAGHLSYLNEEKRVVDLAAPPFTIWDVLAFVENGLTDTISAAQAFRHFAGAVRITHLSSDSILAGKTGDWFIHAEGEPVTVEWPRTQAFVLSCVRAQITSDTHRILTGNLLLFDEDGALLSADSRGALAGTFRYDHPDDGCR